MSRSNTFSYKDPAEFVSYKDPAEFVSYKDPASALELVSLDLGAFHQDPVLVEEVEEEHQNHSILLVSF